MSSFRDFINLILDLVNTAIPVAAGLALLAFFWGIARFMLASGSGDEKAIGDGKKLMVWGLVALFVLVSYKGILAFFGKDLGFELGLPYLPTR